MLQILVYAYLRNIYSSRRIEEFCRNDIRFMWLTGNVTPDHNTINRFRSSRLKDVLKTIFATIVSSSCRRSCKSWCSLYRRDEDGGGCQPLYICLGQVHTYPYIQNSWTAWGDMAVCRVRHQTGTAWFRNPLTYQDITRRKLKRRSAR